MPVDLQSPPPPPTLLVLGRPERLLPRTPSHPSHPSYSSFIKCEQRQGFKHLMQRKEKEEGRSETGTAENTGTEQRKSTGDQALLAAAAAAAGKGNVAMGEPRELRREWVGGGEKTGVLGLAAGSRLNRIFSNARSELKIRNRIFIGWPTCHTEK